MVKIFLLAVAAAWAAVLLPPMLRSRLENRPGSSVTDFSRQLSTLQRAVPTRSVAPMRSMARPLAPSPLQRPAATGRPGRTHVHGGHHQGAQQLRESHNGELARRSEHGVRHQQVRRVSRREVVRRRRTNVLFVLAISTAVTLFLAATTKSSGMVYAFALAFVSLCGYCYKLAQLRQYEQDRSYTGDTHWFAA
ncbi:MAG: hypothetical protein WD023_01315 [Ilumatobacteraceae bacterium]